jgi:hypothetical protein
MNRTMKWAGLGLAFFFCLGVPGARAQQPVAAEPQAPSRRVQAAPEAMPASPVPRLVKFAGVSKDEQGKPRTGVVGVTLAIYKEQEGGAALWVETQNVELDEQGRYAVLLGSTKSEGLPLELFATGEPRWLGVQVNVAKEVEQPRVLLVSVPYALKAADAETLGGKPLSSFVLANPASGGVAGVGTVLNAGTGAIDAATIGGGGTQNFVAKFDATGVNVINSSLFDNGQVGIGTTTPGALLDVQLTTGAPTNALNSRVILNNSSAITGSVLSAFKMTLLDESTATNLSKQPARFQYVRDVSATGGVTAFDAVMTSTSFLNSNAPYPLRGVNIEGPTMATGTTLANFTGLYIGSGGGAGAVTNRFALVTEPGAGNVGIGTTGPGQQLSVAGVIQSTTGGFMFPDGTVQATAGHGGTISAVNTAAGSGLVGGATSGAANLSLLNTCGFAQVLQWNGGGWVCAFVGGGTVTSVGSGLGLTGGPITNSGTLAIDPAVVPQLGTTNIFTNSQVVTANSNGPAMAVTQSGTGDALDVFGTQGGLKVDSQGVVVMQVFGITVNNAPTTGTTLNSVVKPIFPCPPNNGCVINTATTDTGGALGIVVEGAGTTGKATVALLGSVNCNFDGSVTAGDYVQISSTVSGDCHDAGPSYPASGQILGRVITTATGAGLYQMFQFAPELRGP